LTLQKTHKDWLFRAFGSGAVLQYPQAQKNFKKNTISLWPKVLYQPIFPQVSKYPYIIKKSLLTLTSTD